MSKSRSRSEQKILISLFFSLFSSGHRRERRRFLEFHSSGRFHIPNHSCSLPQKCVLAGVAPPPALPARSQKLRVCPFPALARQAASPAAPPPHPRAFGGPTCLTKTKQWDASLAQSPLVRTAGTGRQTVGKRPAWIVLVVPDFKGCAAAEEHPSAANPTSQYLQHIIYASFS